jgi:multidrug efflux pump subunit AcrB/ABC-type multidrug transport system ATPase subunit
MIRFIISRPVLVSMIMVGLCLLGLVSYSQLQVELVPFAELPMLIVQAYSVRETDPKLVTKEAVLPLEGGIGSLEDIERIESYIDQRRAIIFVYYNQNTNLKYAYLKLQQKVDELKSQIGENYFVNVVKIDSEQLSNLFMTLSARGEGSLDQIRHVIDKDVLQDLENIDGVANVEIYGGRSQSIEVLLDEDALRSYGLTPSQVTSALAAGQQQRILAGKAYAPDNQYFVNVTADYTDIAALENVIVKQQGPVLLKHVATIKEGGAEETSISRINGKEALSLTLTRESDANLLSLSSTTHDVIERINKKIAPLGVELVIVNDAARVIKENIDLIKELALVGALLALAILWLFLRNLRLVLLVTAAIPISILVAFNFFYAFGISINILTLVGAAVAIGMLLDNSVVVLENTYRLIPLKKSVTEAVVAGASEVWRPVLAATLTTVCVFLPFIYSENFLVRTLGRQVGVSIISTLLVSLLVAFLLIPAATHWLLTRRKRLPRSSFNIVSQNNRLLQIYTLMLKSSLRFPARTIGWAIALFFLSVILCLAVSLTVPEEAPLTSFPLYVEMPGGTTLETADAEVLKMDDRLKDIAEVEDRRANIEEDQATITFRLKENFEDMSGRDLGEVKDDIIKRLQESFPRASFSYDQPTSNVRYRGGMGGGGGDPTGGAFMRLLGIGLAQEKVIIRGGDMDILRSIADDINYNLQNLASVSQSRLNISEPQPELRLLIDRAAMSHFDVSLNAVAAELASFGNEYSAGVTLKQGTEDIDVRVKTEGVEDKTTDELVNLQVPTNTGSTVPLAQVARPFYSTGYWSVNRVNQENEVQVTYQFQSDISDSKDLLERARAEVDQMVGGIELPAGVAVEVVHDDTDLSDFYFLIVAAFILIYMILASVFESLATPVAMMFTIPLATTGAFWGLVFTGNSILNANSLVGLLILLGVVVNNGIILIDYARLLRRRGFRRQRALMTAGQTRVRPILITTLTTVVAMLPLAMGKAEYVGQIGAPFAITVIGGLSVGTLFTLIFIPTVYQGLESALDWWRRLSWKLKAVQILAFAGGSWLILANIGSLLWRIIDLTTLLLIIPAVTYFAIRSLRRARVDVIPETDEIRITVRNVVKDYDDFSRFVKEFRKRERQKDRLIREGFLSARSDLISLLWHAPIYAFIIYFIYFYLDSGLWIVLLSHAALVYTIALSRRLLLGVQSAGDAPTSRPRLRRLLYKLIFWGAPTANLIFFYLHGNGLALVIYLAILWYPALLVYATSRKLHEQHVDIARIRGRFGTLRRMFYHLVQRVPIIGRRRTPFRALNQVSMTIGSGMFGLVGPNGAGKTTLMRMICGILAPTRGIVEINGLDLARYREELQALIGYLPQEFGTYQNMTAYQFLDYQALLKGMWDPQRRAAAVKQALESVHLENDQDRKIGTFSGGMRQRVGIAQTLLHLPRILVVDEPTAGLDPRERIRFRNLLAQLARDRVVVFSTHIIEDVSSSCNRLAVLDDGEVQFIGSPREMVERVTGRVWQAHLSEESFEKVRQELRVVHHIRDGEEIRVRILSEDKPLAVAKPVVPSLEDAYLWLLGSEVRQ